MLSPDMVEHLAVWAPLEAVVRLEQKLLPLWMQKSHSSRRVFDFLPGFWYNFDSLA